MKEKKTKILATGDIHGDVRFFREILKKSYENNVDLIILAGDLTYGGDVSRKFFDLFKNLKKNVLLIPGNWDSVEIADFLSNEKNIKSIHGKGIGFKDIGIFGAGGGDVGLYVLSENEIFYLLKKGHNEIKDFNKKLMVTHMHPAKSKAEFSGFPGSLSVRRAIKEFSPNILVSAHIHEAGGLEEKINDTQVFHVARKIKIFEI